MCISRIFFLSSTCLLLFELSLVFHQTIKRVLNLNFNLLCFYSVFIHSFSLNFVCIFKCLHLSLFLYRSSLLPCVKASLLSLEIIYAFWIWSAQFLEIVWNTILVFILWSAMEYKRGLVWMKYTFSINWKEYKKNKCNNKHINHIKILGCNFWDFGGQFE